jgi:2-oxoglutarate ferredoxin oxidoreductase subunit alpha
VSKTFKEPTQGFKRGKVLDAAALDKVGKFERYRDVDGDGIPYRTLPGTDHKLAAYFTRGSGHNEAAKYTEKAEDFKNLMDRLNLKFKTARKMVPAPVKQTESGAKIGIIAYGTSDYPMQEARDLLKSKGIKTNYLRLKALPFTDDVKKFYEENDRVFVVEQNRDAQMMQLINLEVGGLCTKSRSVVHYDGLPLDAQTIIEGIANQERM